MSNIIDLAARLAAKESQVNRNRLGLSIFIKNITDNFQFYKDGLINTVELKNALMADFDNTLAVLVELEFLEDK